MKKIYTTITQRAIAYVLLVSQLLTSCGWNETILPSKKQEETTQQKLHKPKLKVLDLTEKEDSTQEISSTLILTDKLTGDQPVQPQQRLGVITTITDQPGHQGPNKDLSDQVPPKEKTLLPLDPTSLKPITSIQKKQLKDFPNQGLPITTPPLEQPETNVVDRQNQPVPFQETLDMVEDISPDSPVIETPLSYGPYTIQGGYQVKFIQQAGKWIAQVQEVFIQGFSREPMLLPVYLEFGLTMEEVSNHPHIDIIVPTKSNNGQGYVVCTRQAGLLGGVKEGDTCIYREDQKVWDEGLGRWVCPGDGKHPRSGPITNNNQSSDSQDKPIGTMVKEMFHGLKQLGTFGGILDIPVSKETNEERLQRQSQEFFDRASRYEMEFLAQKEREKRDEEEYFVYQEIDFIRRNLIDKYKPKNNLISLLHLKTIEAFQQDIVKAIHTIGEKRKELDKIAYKYEGQERVKCHRDPREEVQLEGPFELWQLDVPKEMELYELYVKADRVKDWFIFYEKTIDELQKQADEIYELSKKISTDEAGIKVLEQVINQAKVLQEHIDEAIRAIKWYGGRPDDQSTTYENELRPMPDFEKKSKPKKVPTYQPPNDYKERLASRLRSAKGELETVIKSYTRRKDIAYPHMKKVGESMVNQGIKLVQEQANTLFDYQVETYLVDLRPKKGQEGITDKMFEEIFPTDETVCIEKYLEIMEVVVIGIEKGTKNRKVSTVKINMKSNGPVKMADIDWGNYATLVQKFNQELDPVTSKLNQLIEEGKDPVATLEQAKKVKQCLEKATEELRKYETKQDKKPNLDHFSKLQETIEHRIQLEQHKIFVNNLNQEVNREGSKTRGLIQQKASPAAIIQEASRFKKKVEEMKRQVEQFGYNRDKLLQDLRGIVQTIDQIIKEQGEKMKINEIQVRKEWDQLRDEIQNKFGKTSVSSLAEAYETQRKIQGYVEKVKVYAQQDSLSSSTQQVLKELESLLAQLGTIVEDLKDKARYEELIDGFNDSMEKENEAFNKVQAGYNAEEIITKATAFKMHVEEAIKKLEAFPTKQDKSANLANFRENISTLQEIIQQQSEKKEWLAKYKAALELVGKQYILPKVEEEKEKFIKQTGKPVESYTTTIVPKAGLTIPQIKEMFSGENNTTVNLQKILASVEVKVQLSSGQEESNKNQEDSQKQESNTTQRTENNKEEKTAPIFDPEEITKAAVRAVEEVKAMKGFQNGEAACNIGVNKVFEALTGSKELIDKNSTEVPQPPILSNAMMDHWANSDNWEEIKMSEAQEQANQDYFVVAGWKNPNENRSGHVAVVVPSTRLDGKEEYSGEWKCDVPMTMDTGEGHRWNYKKLSEGFGKNKKDTMKFYRYKGPIIRK